ncbi:hypothetical protein PGH07_04385 [Sulfurovum sp. zt1-1]|uniref:ATP-grasp domain-containing protein n=1 Tax=Sulfurovum zhangzhouensis TaxID=3019067 RepID=A0ABT7QX51_9BACT|nr:hypothetical protein [Sulfurovum zhangzhouensis]MDM5271406.1 hypothetical protein [Sulfurovum zhangzhouensis]
MAKKNILFLNGVPDDNSLKVNQIHKNGNIKWGGSGSANLSDFLKNDFFDRSMVIFDTRGGQELPRQMIHGVFNQISDPDTHKISLQRADDFYKAVAKHVAFFNPPSLVMKTTRDNIYRLLQGIDKLHVPKTVKLQPRSPADIYDVIKNENFEFPVIFRQAGDHGGISTIRIDDETEQFYPFALDGRDHYLTQFVDYANDDGIYAKYRLVVVDGEVFIRHAIFSKEWMVHARNQLDEKESQQYKKDIVDRFAKEIKPKLQPIITEIYNRLKLDYFGIDCNIDSNMNLLIFEINANMNVFTKSKNTLFSKHIEMIRSALIKMLKNKGK